MALELVCGSAQQKGRIWNAAFRFIDDARWLAVQAVNQRSC